jgi:hypothetical protein
VRGCARWRRWCNLTKFAQPFAACDYGAYGAEYLTPASRCGVAERCCCGTECGSSRPRRDQPFGGRGSRSSIGGYSLGDRRPPRASRRWTAGSKAVQPPVKSPGHSPGVAAQDPECGKLHGPVQNGSSTEGKNPSSRDRDDQLHVQSSPPCSLVAPLLVSFLIPISALAAERPSSRLRASIQSRRSPHSRILGQRKSFLANDLVRRWVRLALSSPVCHHEYRRSRTRFDSDLIIHRRSNSLLATQIAFRRLNGNMSQEELHLFQLSSCSVAQAGTGPTKIMRSQLLQSNPPCRILHDVPDNFLCHAFTQDPPHLRHSTEDLTSVDTRSIQPDSQLFHYPTGDRNRANVSCLALQIDNGPVFLSLFKMFDSEANGFVAPQAAGKQQRKKRTISLALELFAVWGSPERKGLFNSQPVAKRTPRFLTPLTRRIPAARRNSAGRCRLPRRRGAERRPGAN